MNRTTQNKNSQNKRKTTGLNEATPKSTREKLHRATRHTLKSKQKKHLKRSHMLDKVTPKKTGNHDPTRGGNRLDNVDEGIKKSVFFIKDNLANSGEKLREAVHQFKYNESLKKLTMHMIATRFGGWKEENGRYINESGREASKSNWVLSENGRLVPRGGRICDYNIEWLLEVNKYCERQEYSY
jgi:hypothetical protein